MVDWLDSAAGASVDNFWVADDVDGSSIPNRVADRPALTLVGSPTVDEDGWDETSPTILLSGSGQYLQANGISGYDGSFTIAIAVFAPDIGNGGQTYWAINSSSESNNDNYRHLQTSFNRLQLVSRENGTATSSPLLGNTAPTVETVYVLSYDAEEELVYTYECKGESAVTLNAGFTVTPQVEEIDTLFVGCRALSAGTPSNYLPGHFKAIATWSQLIEEDEAHAIAEAIFDNANDWPAGENQEGTGAASVVLGGAGVGSSVVLRAGSAVANFEAEANGQATVSSAGTGSVELSATGAGASVRVAIGTADTTLGATATGQALAIADGEAASSISASASGAPLATGTGAAQFQLSATSESTSATTSDGAASLEFTAAGVITQLRTGAGAAAVSLSADATSTLFSNGTAAFELSATGAGASVVVADGSAASAFGALAIGVGAADSVAVGEATVTLSGTAEGLAIWETTGSGELTIGANATGQSLVEANGESTVTFSAAAEPQMSVSVGEASWSIVAHGEATATHLVTGQATVFLSASGLTPGVILALGVGRGDFAFGASGAGQSLSNGVGESTITFATMGRRQVLAELVQTMGTVSAKRRTVVSAPNRRASVTL